MEKKKIAIQPGALWGQDAMKPLKEECPQLTTHRSKVQTVVQKQAHVLKYKLYCPLPSPAMPLMPV